MTWIHRLSNVNLEDRTATCSNCGNVSIKVIGKMRRCREAINADKRKSHLAKTGVKRPETCEACGGTNKISFDHDHTTGAHRGWLCHNCNTALGLLKDNKTTLLNLVEYLSK